MLESKNAFHRTRGPGRQTNSRQQRKETTMNRRMKNYVLTAAIVWSVMFGVGEARGELTFSIVDPAHNGVYAYSHTEEIFTPATENPALAAVNGARSSLRVMDSTLRFSADITGFAGN